MVLVIHWTTPRQGGKERFDEVVQQDGVSVFIDKKAQLSILGTEMDFHESKLASEFGFNNPNISGTCGCGESFSDYKETSRWYLNVGLYASSLLSDPSYEY